MFRASPWITYDPPTSESHPPQPTDNDAEMDAPQISTLHDDGESPPSNASPARTGKFRVKLPVNRAFVHGPPGFSCGSSPKFKEESGAKGYHGCPTCPAQICTKVSEYTFPQPQPRFSIFFFFLA